MIITLFRAIKIILIIAARFLLTCIVAPKIRRTATMMPVEHCPLAVMIHGFLTHAHGVQSVPALINFLPIHYPMKRSSHAFITHKQPNLTNASFRWLPDASMAKNPAGVFGVTLMSQGKLFTLTTMLGSLGHDGFGAVLVYDSPTRAILSERILVPQNEPIHVELDIDPKTSRVVFWLNDTGRDLGVLPGFEGGADSVKWISTGYRNTEKFSGKLSECAVATAAGWASTVFSEKHISSGLLHDDHVFQVNSRNNITIGNSRLLA